MYNLPVLQVPGSKFSCLSQRSAAFHIDSGQPRFAMMRNLTIILRRSNLGYSFMLRLRYYYMKPRAIIGIMALDETVGLFGVSVT